MARARKPRGTPAIVLPSPHDWRTTDEDEVNRRKVRAVEESFRIVNDDPTHPVFSNFTVGSQSGMRYRVEIRDLATRQFSCTCTDFRHNDLGTCKHVEATILLVRRRFGRLAAAGSPRHDVVPDANRSTLRLDPAATAPVPRPLKQRFTPYLVGQGPEEALPELTQLAARYPALRISQDVAPWIAACARIQERTATRRAYEQKVQAGEWPAHETLVPLYPYQREGMLHLAFTERALLADEMGLGKTIQAIAACALLRRLGLAARALVVTPASLKTEWEEQIRRFTTLDLRLVFGRREERLKLFQSAPSPFFTIVNYEQVMRDAMDINRTLRPDVVILDEAQRIKNWGTKTAQAVKRLESRFAFVLTGTPIENRIDELYSLMDYLHPGVLGPLFRFNREYYQLDERGKPAGFKNLRQLHDRVRPYMLRRRKRDVETELPDRTDRHFFVPMSAVQQAAYLDHETQAARLMDLAKRRPLTKQEMDKLMRELAMMRMLCDTPFILNPDDRTCPKLAEIETILEEARANEDVKVIVFSEWERMLTLVRDLCAELKIGYAWHTGSVPQLRRRAEINAFKNDPSCRIFLSTDSGSTGLNLQNASIVINCDLPWNPAKLEQRIARAWRKHQTRPVTVINLVSEGTIEHRMIGTLASKLALSEGVLDLQGDLDALSVAGGRNAFLSKLEQVMTVAAHKSVPPPPPPVPSSDRPQAFAAAAAQLLGAALVRCEERFPPDAPHSVLLLVVERDAGQRAAQLQALYATWFADVDPLAPVHLEVIDRATDEALERLVTLGLVRAAHRTARPLLASPSQVPTLLSPAEMARAEAYRSAAKRELEIARVLGPAGFAPEARAALLKAGAALAGAFAVEAQVPEPDTIEAALEGPAAAAWGDTGERIKEWLRADTPDWAVMATALGSRLAE